MRNRLKFAAVLLIVGFLVAVQYNTIQKPEERDTRDIWAIRNELANEKVLHSQLLSEIRELNKTIHSYESLEDENTEKVLKSTVDKLYEQAGMLDSVGPGVVIEIQPSPESIAFGEEITDISPDLLTRFINEVNRNNWKSLEIDGKRYTTLSSIRDINGITAINGVNISKPPFEMRIITETFADSEKLFIALQSSSIQGDFYVDNLILEIGEPEENVEIRGWKERPNNLYLNELPKGE